MPERRATSTGATVSLPDLISQLYNVIIVAVVCAAVVLIVRMVLEHKERSDRRRDDVLRTPLDKFSDYDDEAERLAEKYEDTGKRTYRQARHRSRTAEQSHASSLINITINKNSNNSGSYNNSQFGASDGRNWNQYNDPESSKSLIVAFALCFFLGVFGAHYLYCGRFWMGVLYFFTGGLFGIGWLVDLIRIGIGKFRDKRGLYLRW